MFFYLVKILNIIFVIYGILNILNDFCTPPICKKMICILYVKNIENEIEYYIREIKKIKNQFNRIVVVDEHSSDNTYNLLKQYERDDEKIYIMKEKNIF